MSGKLSYKRALKLKFFKTMECKVYLFWFITFHILSKRINGYESISCFEIENHLRQKIYILIVHAVNCKNSQSWERFGRQYDLQNDNCNKT